MKENVRSEEMHDIIEKMPGKFGRGVTLIIVFLFVIILTLGFIVNYPDIVTGQIQMRKGSFPIKIVTKNSGIIKLLIPLKESEPVNQGDYLAYFENPTNVNSVRSLKNIITVFQYSDNYQFLSKSLSSPIIQYGELTSKVKQLQGITEKLLLFKKANIYARQSYNLKNELIEQQKLLKEIELQIKVRKENLDLARQIFLRDSILFEKDLISKLEYEKSNQNYLGYEESLYNLTKERLNLQQKSKNMTGQDALSNVQFYDKNQEITTQFDYYFHDLLESIKDWEQKYVILCPVPGRLNILKYVEENEFIKAGEELFAVIPEADKSMDGIIQISTAGAGKIRKNQKVIVKLDDFPYREFGTVQGSVKDVATVSKTVVDSKFQQSSSYLITVSFPHQITTSFGTLLKLKSGEQGTAEIITAERQLIDRVFKNVKYSTNKN
jgi:multidrug efflux pump subunit AcrA (membrane-fusion protein)